MNDKNLHPHKYQKGQSGNPGGRPLGSRNRSTIARQVLQTVAKMPDAMFDKVKDLFGLESNVMTVEELATLSILAKAIVKSDPAAYRAVMDSAYGLPKQTIEAEVLPASYRDPSEMTDEEIAEELARLEAEETDFELLEDGTDSE